MNVKATNKVETNRYELELEVSAEEFNEAINAVYKRESKKITMAKYTAVSSKLMRPNPGDIKIADKNMNPATQPPITMLTMVKM